MSTTHLILCSNVLLSYLNPYCTYILLSVCSIFPFRPPLVQLMSGWIGVELGVDPTLLPVPHWYAPSRGGRGWKWVLTLPAPPAAPLGTPHVGVDWGRSGCWSHTASRPGPPWYAPCRGGWGWKWVLTPHCPPVLATISGTGERCNYSAQFILNRPATSINSTPQQTSKSSIHSSIYSSILSREFSVSIHTSTHSLELLFYLLIQSTYCILSFIHPFI